MQKPLSDLYAALCARAQEPAPEGARALYIAGRRCGWATHAACDALRDAPETQSDGTALRIGEGLAPGNAFAPEAQGWLRWCFASRDPRRLEEGVRRLQGWLDAQGRR